jgi:DNA-binding XRE family transcriptional regulator
MLHAVSRRPEEPVYNRLEFVREKAGLTRAELADLVGVHYQTIGYLEREEYSPSLILALRIAAALKTQVTDLFALRPFKPEPHETESNSKRRQK